MDTDHTDCEIVAAALTWLAMWHENWFRDQDGSVLCWDCRDDLRVAPLSDH